MQGALDSGRLLLEIIINKHAHTHMLTCTQTKAHTWVHTYEARGAEADETIWVCDLPLPPPRSRWAAVYIGTWDQGKGG